MLRVAFRKRTMWKDQRGNVALAFALSLLPIVTAAGVAIDYARLSHASTRLSSALDSAALAVAKDITIVDENALKSRIEAFVRANTPQSLSDSLTVQLEPTDASIVSVKSRTCLQLMFKGLIAGDQVCVTARTQAQRPSMNYIEVALVLDNSGSMAGAKMDALKQAASSFIDELLSGNSEPEKVKISIVPFTLAVNAGAVMNANSDPNIDRFGTSSIHWQNLTPNGVPPAGIQSRLTLFSQLNEPWGGCFEMRPGNWGLTDAAPTQAIGDSLFVPMFAPDEPGLRGYTGLRQSTLNHLGSGSTFSVSNSYLNDDGSQSNTYSNNMEWGATNPACTPTAAAFALPFNSATPNWQSRNFSHRATSNICRYNLTGTAGAPSQRKSIAHTAGTNGAGRGPNYLCSTIPLQRLTNNQAALQAKVNEMKADGGTNILEGVMWGWRTLSPNAPFADGRSYNWESGRIRNRKFIVVMTDGDNVWNALSNPNGSIYSPFGYFKDNRLGPGLSTTNDATLRINEYTRRACDNVKAVRNGSNEEAIKIFTVGFSTPGQEISSTGLSLLQDCASTENGQKLYYQATNTQELNEIFARIVSNIGRLKLTM